MNKYIEAYKKTSNYTVKQLVDPEFRANVHLMEEACIKAAKYDELVALHVPQPVRIRKPNANKIVVSCPHCKRVLHFLSPTSKVFTQPVMCPDCFQVLDWDNVEEALCPKS
jgi:hypothetical protein